MQNLLVIFLVSITSLSSLGMQKKIFENFLDELSEAQNSDLILLFDEETTYCDRGMIKNKIKNLFAFLQDKKINFIRDFDNDYYTKEEAKIIKASYYYCKLIKYFERCESFIFSTQEYEQYSYSLKLLKAAGDPCCAACPGFMMYSPLVGIIIGLATTQAAGEGTLGVFKGIASCCLTTWLISSYCLFMADFNATEEPFKATDAKYLLANLHSKL